MDPENQRIRDYLIAQAGEKPVDVLVERVREGVSDLEAAARIVPEDRYGDTPAGETWTPRQCLEHALGSNMQVAQQVLHAAWGSEPPDNSEPSVPDSVEAALSKHGEAMESLYEHVLSADPEGNLDQRWEHPMFGDLNWREWLLFLRIHCKDHARQLEAMAAGL
jgi:hypothetical protein